MAKIPGVYDFFNEQWFSNCQSVYITSDFHFGDNDLKQAFPNRPTDEELVSRINSICGKNDCLIMLGDCGNTKYIPQLRAKRKIILLGNHDKGASNYQRQTWTLKFNKDLYTQQEAIASMRHAHSNCRYEFDEGYQFNSPFEFWWTFADNQLFDFVFTGPLVLGEKLILSHEPVDVPWACNIHGHDHAGQKRENHLNVCLDVCDYTPINLNTLMKQGLTVNIEPLHRTTIDKATDQKAKRGGRKLGEK